MLRVMTLCTGNICRSPMAQVVLNRYLADAGLGDDVRVISRGTSDEEHGNPIDHRAQQVLAAAGYKVPDHRAARVTRAELAEHDLVLAMTYGHYRIVERMASAAPGVLTMYRSFDPRFAGSKVGPQLDIEDPWYGGFADFEVALEQIEAAAPAIVASLAKKR